MMIPANHHHRWQMWTTGRWPTKGMKPMLHVLDIHAPHRRNTRGKPLAICGAVVRDKFAQHMPTRVDVLHQYPRVCRPCIRAAKVAMKAIEESA